METDDEYCRRKDRYYELLADQLVAAKRERDTLKSLKVSSRSAIAEEVALIPP
jgi:hypothetical protein